MIKQSYVGGLKLYTMSLNDILPILEQIAKEHNCKLCDRAVLDIFFKNVKL